MPYQSLIKAWLALDTLHCSFVNLVSFTFTLSNNRYYQFTIDTRESGARRCLIWQHISAGNRYLLYIFERLSSELSPNHS